MIGRYVIKAWTAYWLNLTNIWFPWLAAMAKQERRDHR
jgi:hypothetical protein